MVRAAGKLWRGEDVARGMHVTAEPSGCEVCRVADGCGSSAGGNSL